MDIRQTDTVAGLLFILVSLTVLFLAFQMNVGTPSNMGAGFFPAMLAVVLMIVGIQRIYIAIFRDKKEFITVNGSEWIALAYLAAAIILFGLALNHLGFLVSSVLSTMLAQAGSVKFRFVQSAVVGISLTVFCYVVFIVALGLRLPVFPAGW